jgi:hypothetical protein
VLVDLASVGVMRRDAEQTISYATAAMELAGQSDSGVIARKLAGLAQQLSTRQQDSRLSNLSRDISARIAVERSAL